jgi:hypothetical protein
VLPEDVLMDLDRAKSRIGAFKIEFRVVGELELALDRELGPRFVPVFLKEYLKVIASFRNRWWDCTILRRYELIGFQN